MCLATLPVDNDNNSRLQTINDCIGFLKLLPMSQNHLLRMFWLLPHVLHLNLNLNDSIIHTPAAKSMA